MNTEATLLTSILIKVADWAWAGAMALWLFSWRHHNGRVDKLEATTTENHKTLDKKIEDKTTSTAKYVDSVGSMIMSEVNRQRDTSAKIFEKLEEHAQRSENRHLELLKALHEGLARKADK
jgi:hypothetical protein